MGAAVEFNHFGKYPGELQRWLDDLIYDHADTIASDIEGSLGGLADVDLEVKGDHVLIEVGPGNEPYWLGFVEFGTFNRPAHPRVVPAAERGRPRFFRDAEDMDKAFKR